MTVLSGSVLVTGATGGLGQAIARALAARGARLLLTGRRSDVLEPLGAELGARAIALRPVAPRARSSGWPQEAGRASTCSSRTRRCRPAASSTELSQEQIDAMLEVNLRAPIALARALVPAMVERGRGHLVFISSLSGQGGLAGLVDVLGDQVRPARLRARAARGSAPARRRRLGRAARASSATPACSPTPASTLPPGVGTRSPQDVAAAVVKAIEHNRAEVEVAPLGAAARRVDRSLAPELPRR